MQEKVPNGESIILVIFIQDVFHSQWPDSIKNNSQNLDKERSSDKIPRYRCKSFA